MFERWRGPGIVGLILGAVLLVLALNLNTKGPSGPASPVITGASPPLAPTGAGRRPAGFREYPIGDEVVKNEMRIAAVWLPPVEMEAPGFASSGPSSMIHLEADIHATEGSRHGFAKDEFVPYLTIRYTILPRDAQAKSSAHEPLRGTMMPMVARDGWHYGASIEMPRAGRYTLTYMIEPPSSGGAGRHSDSVTGVDPWWKPFEVSFDWEYAGPPQGAQR